METLQWEGPDASGLATLTLQRPGHLNSLDGTMVEELEAVLTEVAENRAIRVLRLTGAGRGFMAGGDLRWFAGMFASCTDPDQRREVVAEEIRSVVRRVEAIDALAASRRAGLM